MHGQVGPLPPRLRSRHDLQRHWPGIDDGALDDQYVSACRLALTVQVGANPLSPTQAVDQHSKRAEIYGLARVDLFFNALSFRDTVPARLGRVSRSPAACRPPGDVPKVPWPRSRSGRPIPCASLRVPRLPITMPTRLECPLRGGINSISRIAPSAVSK